MPKVLKRFDPWNSPLCPCPPKYTINPYTGCGFKCIYCYITGYVKDAFRPRPKKNLINNLMNDLKKVGGRKVVAISYSTDPYTPPEGSLNLTRKILKILVNEGFSILIATKSPLVTRDIDLLERTKSVVSITITTIDDELAKVIEPHAPSPSSRIKAIEKLTSRGIPVSLRIDPILPYVTDDFKMIKILIDEVSSLGVSHIVSSVYKAKPDSFKRILSIFPGLREKYTRLYNELGFFIYGYRYAAYQYRYYVLNKLREIAKTYGLQFSTCREGLRYLDDKGTFCDGSHLIH